MIMLGAILTTLVVLLIGAGLPNFKGVITDPEIGNGKILVGVVDPPESSQAELERRLQQAGASQVKQFSEKLALGSASVNATGLDVGDVDRLGRRFNVPVTVTFAPANAAALLLIVELIGGLCGGIEKRVFPAHVHAANGTVLRDFRLSAP